ncbi:M20/M25/M40 family metallo-hydrolase [Prescottella subtropica]|uniref:M20/M25/M40 family metallo-hydrolase n=1 Tax=Prescottella subtropica TaxID=2545757 RepID=UPI0010F5E3CE|nr:M20/M25/M40 family metallo-hydrolase [Prescottella subtropica]
MRTVLAGMLGVLLLGPGLLVAGCGDPDDVDVPVDGPSLAAAVDPDTAFGDLEQLQRIADEHGGNRAVGTPGYDASVDYVVGQLEDAGFDVDTPEFAVDVFTVQAETLRVGGRDVPTTTLGYSPSTPPGGLTARLVPLAPGEAPGCDASSYDGLDASGAVVLVDRGGCPFARKQQVAADRGAAAVVVADNVDEDLIGGTLGGRDAARIPSAAVTQADGAALRDAANDTAVTLVLDTTTDSAVSRNVIAQTRTGDGGNVVMAGAHLDSVPAGPGIDDNGSGVAALLETARALGASPEISNAVRFAFWGAEEVGLVGSEAYVAGLDDAARADIALYLNFDMVGSHNAGYFVYDGDDSDAVGEGPGPDGSAGIERAFEAILLQSGTSPDGTDFDGRSDYGPFIAAGIPAGGLFTGADETKTAAQARKWGGDADTMFDPNYHTVRDTLDAVDRAALDTNVRTIAYGIGQYAQSIDGPNGVPDAGDARATARAGTPK